MAYAIIQINGKQYKVSPKEEITVDRLPYKEGEKVTHTDVLLVSDGDTITVGTPAVKNASVVFTVKNHERGEKIRVAKFKSKSRYRRVKGHRQELSVLSIEDIKI
jgi:large subunit ribosomal protein L21